MHLDTKADPQADSVRHEGTVTADADVGRKLHAAQSADHAWRTNLLLGLYGRILWLRRFDRVVQYTGAGVGVVLLVAAFFAFFANLEAWDADGLARRVLSLIAGAMATSASGLVLVGIIASCQARIRRWIVETGLDEHLERLDDSGSAAKDLRSSPSGTGTYINTDRFFAVAAWIVVMVVSFLVVEAALKTLEPK